MLQSICEYNSLKSAANWAQITLDKHRCDPRQYTYTKAQFERAETHDCLWNAAQRQIVNEGKMHGFMRMYWAKGILQWTLKPEDALNIAIYLNDKYSIDGCVPNGYVGIMWSICGIHDRAFAERPIIGKIRPMTYEGCARKFKIAEYMERYKSFV